MTLPARMELTGTFMAYRGSNEWNSASHASAGRGRRRACIKGRGWPQPGSKAQLGLLLPGQRGGDHAMGALDVGLHLGVGQGLGVVDRDPLGAGEVGRGPEAGRARQCLIMLGRRLEADA